MSYLKILWLINVSLPEASKLLGEKPSPFGGWLIYASKKIATNEGFELFIAFPSNKANKLVELEGDKIKYYLFAPINDKDKKVIEFNKTFEKLVNIIKPDIVHIFGTELPHSLSMLNTCNNLGIKTIISIQGLVSIIEKHLYNNLPLHVIYGRTLRNLIRKDSICDLKKVYKNRGKNEIDIIKKANHIIGRTSLDKAYINQINPKAKYYFCNEILREEFYKHQWDIKNCEKFSIFLSQGHYPIKGLHYVLEALSIIIKHFPDAKLYVSGKNLIKYDTINDKLQITYYGKYIRKMILKLGLENNVIFTGLLDEKSMCERYLKSHVFVCPSSIENSPNSLGEAMILGVPCVASYVGGIPDMLIDKEDGFLYHHDAPYMLAHYICEIFNQEELAKKFSINARHHAMKTHDPTTNTLQLINIYKNILSKDIDKDD